MPNLNTLPALVHTLASDIENNKRLTMVRSHNTRFKLYHKNKFIREFNDIDVALNRYNKL